MLARLGNVLVQMTLKFKCDKKEGIFIMMDVFTYLEWCGRAPQLAEGNSTNFNKELDEEEISDGVFM